MQDVDVVHIRDRLSFRFSEVPVFGNRTFTDYIFSQAPIDRNTGINIALTDTHTWGGNKVNEILLGYSRTLIYREENDAQLSHNWFHQYRFSSFLHNPFPTPPPPPPFLLFCPHH